MHGGSTPPMAARSRSSPVRAPIAASWITCPATPELRRPAMPAEVRKPSPRSVDPPPRTVQPPVLALVRGLADAAEEERESGQIASGLLALRLAPHDPQAATLALSPGLDDSASAIALRGWLIQSLLLE